MQWLPFLVISVWCITRGRCIDFECFNKEAVKCFEETAKMDTGMTRFDFCNVQKKVVSCSTESAIKCNTNFINEAKKVQSVVDAMCEKGSKMNKVMEKHRECIVKSIVDIKCVNFIKGIIGTNPTPEDILNAQKEACRRIDKISTCTTKLVKDNCPSEGLEAFKILYDPSMELQKRICEEIIFPHVRSDNPRKGKLPVFYGPLEFII